MKIKTTKKVSFIKRTSSERKKQVLSFYMPILFLMLICSIFLTSCKEDVIGQYPVDSTPPQKISNPIVTNIKGGAIIKYDLPKDKDLLFVKAIYKLPNGTQKETLASAFVNELTVKGFARSTKTNVQLIAVDRSQNESDPVTVEIEPFDSPIFDIYESLSVKAGFGGIKLNWENTTNEEIVVGVLYKNEENSFVPLENFYSSIDLGDVAVRGVESEETEFGIYIRDIFNNYTDTLVLKLTPWEESELDKLLWKAMPLCPSFTVSHFGRAMPVLWDGITITNAPAVYYVNTASDRRIFFTIDLGVSTKLSRFKFWGRDFWYFNLHHPKEIEIWGTNDPVVADGDACSWDGWELLLSATSVKPSGPDPIGFDDLTTEDLALAHAGEEFEFPLEAPIVRYVRFRIVRSWTDSNSVFMAEVTFWGQIIE